MILIRNLMVKAAIDTCYLATSGPIRALTPLATIRPSWRPASRASAPVTASPRTRCARAGSCRTGRLAARGRRPVGAGSLACRYDAAVAAYVWLVELTELSSRHGRLPPLAPWRCALTELSWCRGDHIRPARCRGRRCAVLGGGSQHGASGGGLRPSGSGRLPGEGERPPRGASLSVSCLAPLVMCRCAHLLAMVRKNNGRAATRRGHPGPAAPDSAPRPRPRSGSCGRRRGVEGCSRRDWRPCPASGSASGRSARWSARWR